jgi:hypothetical protein
MTGLKDCVFGMTANECQTGTRKCAALVQADELNVVLTPLHSNSLERNRTNTHRSSLQAADDKKKQRIYKKKNLKSSRAGTPSGDGLDRLSKISCQAVRPVAGITQ